MYIDWVTWTIWVIGFAIMAIWIIVPYREFKRILRKHREQQGGGGVS